MSNTKRFTNMAAVTLAVSCLSAALCAHAGRPRTVVAVYSQADSYFSETVTLYDDGKYRQSETQREAQRPRGFSLHALLFPTPVLPKSLREPKRDGVWRVLDKEDGVPLPFKAGAGLPPNAVVELKGAMPFGMTWDNRLPYGLHGNRALSTGSFQAAPPAREWSVSAEPGLPAE